MDEKGSEEVIAYARRIGLVKDDSGRLDVKNAMAAYSLNSIWVFFDHFFSSCKHESRNMLCLEQTDYLSIITEHQELSEILETLKSLKVDAEYKNRIAGDFVFHQEAKKAIQAEFNAKSNESVILTIKDLNEKYPSKHLDWLTMFNNLLLRDSQMTLDDIILIRNPQLLEKLHKLFESLEES